MAKPKILSLLAFLFLVLSLTLVSADYQVKNTTTMLFTISKTSGLVNASYNMAENGVLLSNTYCKLTGCSYTGGIVVTGNVNATEVYIGGRRKSNYCLVSNASRICRGAGIGGRFARTMGLQSGATRVLSRP